NCRFQLSIRNPNVPVKGFPPHLDGFYSNCPTTILQNCEFVHVAVPGRAIALDGMWNGWNATGQQLILDNNVVACANPFLGGLVLVNHQPKSPPFDVHLTRNTFAGPVTCTCSWIVGTATRRTLPAPELYRFDSTENVFATGLLFTVNNG